jgi:hypothetical protein
MNFKRQEKRSHTKKIPDRNGQPKRTRILYEPQKIRLFAFVAVAAGTFIRGAIASIPHVDGREGTIRTRIVVTAARHVTANTFVYRSFDHKNKPPCH